MRISIICSSPNIRMILSRRMRWAGHVLCMGEMRNAYTILVGKPRRKRPLGRPRHRWEDNISMDLWKVVLKGIGFIWFRIGTGGGLL
jgi:hypothetical protein